MFQRLNNLHFVLKKAFTLISFLPTRISSMSGMPHNIYYARRPETGFHLPDRESNS